MTFLLVVRVNNSSNSNNSSSNADTPMCLLQMNFLIVYNFLFVQNVKTQFEIITCVSNFEQNVMNGISPKLLFISLTFYL